MNQSNVEKTTGFICTDGFEHRIGQNAIDAGHGARPSGPQICLKCNRTLEALIASETAQVEKAYGGCHNCYGKGYATYSGEYAAKGMRWNAEKIKYCECPRGKQLEELTTSESDKARADELNNVVINWNNLSWQILEERIATLTQEKNK